MLYRINVSYKGKHLFATADNTGNSLNKMRAVDLSCEIARKFPDCEVTLTHEIMTVTELKNWAPSE